MDKCFYLNGFPPGHKYHGKSMKLPNKRKPTANQVKGEAEAIKGVEPRHKATTSDGPKFTTEEYNQLMVMFKKTNLDGNTQHYANATGIITPSSNMSAVSSQKILYWIIDSGATNHISPLSHLLNKKSLSMFKSIQMPNGGQ
ncbi:hypothetical protein PS1_000621 [Malus domestica]